MSILRAATVGKLRASVRGRVHLPADSGFEPARRPWNLAVEQDVCAVVEAADADDIVALVRYAQSQGLSIAVQPSGHGATGRARGSVLLRTTRLESIDIDPARRTARVGAGVRAGDLQRAAAAHGLTALPGSSPVVTVTGAALGGGLSWFGRSFGWMADSVLAFEIVAADGTRQHVTPETDPELFWALRGGGGDLVIVTAMELQLHPAPRVFGGRQLWSAASARQVAEVYRSMTETAPDALTLWFEVLNFPGADPMVAIDVTFLGSETDARRLMTEVDRLPAPIVDTRSPMSAGDLGTITAEPTAPSPGRARGELLTAFDDDVFASLIDEPIAPLLTVQLRHLGGALARPSDSPHGALTEPYAAYMFGVPSTDAIGDAIASKQATLAHSLPVSGRKPITFLNPSEKLSAALGSESIRRLRRLKGERDPANVIRGNFGTSDG